MTRANGVCVQVDGAFDEHPHVWRRDFGKRQPRSEFDRFRKSQLHGYYKRS